MNIDNDTLQKLKDLLNTQKGAQLKDELSKIDKNKFNEMLKNIDLSSVDMNELKKKIETTPKDELMKNLKNVKDKYFGR